MRKHPEFLGFGSLHPDYKDSFGQAEFCKEHGIRGIKLHPDFQKFDIDDKKAYHIYEAAEAAGLPVLFHMGDNRYDSLCPDKAQKSFKDFPNMVAFAAHLGGYQRWADAADVLADEKNVQFDTCSSLMFISPEVAKKQIMLFGIDKIFFGTDFPMWNHLDELGNIYGAWSFEEENKIILSENFKRFFGL